MNILLLALAIVFWPVTLIIITIRYCWPIFLLLLLFGIIGEMIKSITDTLNKIMNYKLTHYIIKSIINVMKIINNILCLGIYKQKLLSYKDETKVAYMDELGKNFVMLVWMLFIDSVILYSILICIWGEV